MSEITVDEYLEKFFSVQLKNFEPITLIELDNLKSKKDAFGNLIEVGDVVLFCMVETDHELELITIIKRLFNSNSIETFNNMYHCIRHSDLIPYFKRKINEGQQQHKLLHGSRAPS